MHCAGVRSNAESSVVTASCTEAELLGNITPEHTRAFPSFRPLTLCGRVEKRTPSRHTATKRILTVGEVAVGLDWAEVFALGGVW